MYDTDAILAAAARYVAGQTNLTLPPELADLPHHQPREVVHGVARAVNALDTIRAAYRPQHAKHQPPEQPLPGARPHRPRKPGRAPAPSTNRRYPQS